MRKTKIIVFFLLSAFACHAQVTRDQAMARAAAYQSFSDKSLMMITASSAAIAVGMGALTPSQVLSIASGYQGIDDHSLAAISAYGMANAFTTPSTNAVFITLTNSLLQTNVNFFGYNTFYSNSITTATTPAFEPFGGEYVGLHISNSAAISASVNQQAIGFTSTTKFDTANRRIVIRDSTFWSDGASGDAAYFGETLVNPGCATNDLYFYNDAFHSANNCFFLYGFWRSTFNNCTFEGSYGFEPDQGPNTNVLIGCRWDITAAVQPNGSASGSVGIGVLSQIRSYTTYIGGYMNLVTTNASGWVSGLSFSAEGNYVNIFKGTHFHLTGAGTNTIMDVRLLGAGTANTVIFDDVTWDGTNNESAGNVVIQNLDPGGSANNPTVIVIGGQLTIANFASPVGVTFLTESWEVATNSMSAQTITLGKSVQTNMSAGITFTGFGNNPDGTRERFGRAMLVNESGSDQTVITPATWKMSDFLTSRVNTNHNTLEIQLDVNAGKWTNGTIVHRK